MNHSGEVHLEEQRILDEQRLQVEQEIKEGTQKPTVMSTTLSSSHNRETRRVHSRSLPQKLQAQEERSMKMFQKQARDGKAEKKKSKRLRRVSKPNAEGDGHPTSR